MKSFYDQINYEILNSLAEGVYIIDKEFIIKFVNKTALKLTGKKAADLIGKPCKIFCGSERCAFGCPITEILKSGKNIIDLDSAIQKKHGITFQVKLNAAVLRDDNNKPVGGIISFRDMTRLKELERTENDNIGFFNIVGKSQKMLEMYDLIREIKESRAPVLITGETGVGKELVADAIKKTSLRKDKPFVKINCAVLPPNLLTSELFGHVKGAFTDAVRDRVGRFEIADGGTIFLDEIGEMELNMQTQILRVLQEGTFERLGDSVTKEVDVRILAATNKNLIEEVKMKRFRDDLFYRLNVIPIHVPPLRSRKEDIPLLSDYFVKKLELHYKKNIVSVSDEALEALMEYSWPGNVRELESALEYAFIRSKRADSICICSLPPAVRKKCDCNKFDLNQKFKAEKLQSILSLLKQNNWNKTKVAKILGINRSTIYRQLKSIDKK